MILRVDVQPELLRWACERAGMMVDELQSRFPKLDAWLRGDSQPTLKQLERFANATHTPVGYLLLPAPPEEKAPIPDLRTIGSMRTRRPSANMLETIYQCQQRQEWFREFASIRRLDRLSFVDSVALSTPPVRVAKSISETLRFSLSARDCFRSWSDALRGLIDLAEAIGVLVMVSGIVGSQTHRKLEPEEFRGFALSDAFAPLVFVNGADTKAAQIFTLAHELAHLWLGETALSNSSPSTFSEEDIERWCNQVAAELLVPLDELKQHYKGDHELNVELDRLAKHFKVSTLVILRRVLDAGFMSRERFSREYRVELKRVLGFAAESRTGGNYYPTQVLRVSRRFALALVESTLEGQTLYRDALRLAGCKKVDTFHKLGEHLRSA